MKVSTLFVAIVAAVAAIVSAEEAATEDRELARTLGCGLHNGMKKAVCMKKAALGCAVSWVGMGCCKNENKNGECKGDRWGDGGCQRTDYCGFMCRDKCRMFQSRGCAWRNNRCVTLTPVEYEYDYEY